MSPQVCLWRKCTSLTDYNSRSFCLSLSAGRFTTTPPNQKRVPAMTTTPALTSQIRRTATPDLLCAVHATETPSKAVGDLGREGLQGQTAFYWEKLFAYVSVRNKYNCSCDRRQKKHHFLS